MTATGTIDVVVPDIGDFDVVPIIEILVSPGDTVAVDDPLVTLESDKATMDVPAPAAGVVKELKVKLGDSVSQGSLLLTLEGESGAGGSGEGAPAGAGVSAESGAPGSNGAAAPEGTAGAAGAAVPPPAPPDDAPAAAASAPTPPAPSAGTPTAPAGDSEGASAANGPAYASPSVRRVARELGVDLTTVAGTGRKGRITKADVEAALGRGGGGAGAGGSAAAGGGAGTGAAAVAGLELAPWPKIDFEKFGPVERVPRSRISKIAGANLARNWVMIPHVTHNDEADITDLEAFRKQLNDEHARDGVKLTMVGFLVAASVATLKQFPNFNSSLDGDELVLKRYYNVGFAADTPNGLVVPVIKDADRKGILDIARELTELSGRAREGKLAPGDMQGATFTISSLGGIGGTSFSPIINAPEVAILGVTRSAIKPVWNGSEFVPRLMVPLSLSYDHRVIDGAAAARFVVHLTKVLSDLRRALL
jgi:pyruvate dehydrogenase E2 component (dihydrolipoamide acetyltransferase)